MNRERVLKVVLVVVGLLFSAGIYLLVESLSKPMEPELELGQMFRGVYLTLRIFVLLAARRPSANGRMIAFAAWPRLAHAPVMAAVGESFGEAREAPRTVGPGAGVL